MKPDHPLPTPHIHLPGDPLLQGFPQGFPQTPPPGFPQHLLQGFPGPPPWDPLSRDTTPLQAPPLPWLSLRPGRGRAHTNTTPTIISDITASAATRPASSRGERGPHPEQKPGGWGPDKKVSEGVLGLWDCALATGRRGAWIPDCAWRMEGKMEIPSRSSGPGLLGALCNGA